MSVIRNLHTNDFEAVEISSRIEARDITAYTERWMPLMSAKIEELRRNGELNLQSVTDWNVADAHWRWPTKFQERTGQLQWGSYALRCGGDTQGLMYVNLLQRCRLPSQATQHMVYIDLVATAPWNRRRLAPQPLYAGVGQVLVMEAVLRSMDEDFEGRIGLHSLPGSESFYRRIGMECLGPDPQYDGLPYYELTPQQAGKLLNIR